MTGDKARRIVQEHKYGVIHLDAGWYGYAALIARAKASGHDDVAFGYLVIDMHQEFAREVGIINVPSVVTITMEHWSASDKMSRKISTLSRGRGARHFQLH